MFARNRVQVLPPFVAERIAAGEVIERPSSVVKELVENSLDAGATEIAVTLEDGGRTMIEVLDNGLGMSRDDLALAIQRHATSKLRTLDDLERLRTLGFRGEALPSIAAVSDFSIVTRAEGSERSHELRTGWLGASEARVEPIAFGHYLGSSHGTRVRAQGLFAQVPARLKFLKSPASELAHVREWMERLALSHPEVGFRLLSGDRTVMNLRPCLDREGSASGTEARVRQVLADGEDYPVVFAEREVGATGRARAYWLQGLSSPQTRRLVQVVNGRAVRDRLLQQALLAPFKQALLPGQFPAVALFLDLDPGQVDVNVHPAKSEVRFLDSRGVFQSVEGLLSAMIAAHGAPAFAAGGAPGELAFAGRPAGGQALQQPGFRWTAAEPGFRAVTAQGPSQCHGQSDGPPATESGIPYTAHPLTMGRYLGIAFRTYLLFDLGDELAVVDQHAAHERVRFEALKRRALSGASGAASQSLLIPEAVKFDPERRQDLESRLEWLGQLGFETEIFGEDALLFRAIPGEWENAELSSRLRNLLERVLDAQSPAAAALDEALFERLAMEACRSSVRAGDRVEPEQARALVDQLFACEHPWNCPHGRPTVARVPSARFEEWFQRRVP